MMARFANLIWLLCLLACSGVLLAMGTCQCEWRELQRDLVVGVFSALVLLVLIEVRELVLDQIRYGKFQGTYRRIEIYQVIPGRTADTKYESMAKDYENVQSLVTLTYEGGRRYSLDADYKQGHVKGVLYIDQVDSGQGKGHYQYIAVKEGHPGRDMGDYELRTDELDSNRLYLTHQNFIPSGLAEGYEVLVRTQS